MGGSLALLMDPRPGRDPSWRPPSKEPRKATKRSKWPRRCGARHVLGCRRPVIRGEAFVLPSGGVWHLSCVRRYLRQVHVWDRGFPPEQLRLRQEELRYWFGLGGSADLPEVISDDED